MWCADMPGVCNTAGCPRLPKAMAFLCMRAWLIYAPQCIAHASAGDAMSPHAHVLHWPALGSQCLTASCLPPLLQRLGEHEGQGLLPGYAARLAGSLTDGLVHSPLPELAVLRAVPRHLALAHLHRPLSTFCDTCTQVPRNHSVILEVKAHRQHICLGLPYHT